MTVTKYLCGKIILENLRVLHKRSLEKKLLNAGKSSLGSTTKYLAAEDKRRKEDLKGCCPPCCNICSKLCRGRGFSCSRLWLAATRKPDSMATKTYKK